MKSYEAARGYFGFLSTICWIAVFLGGLMAVLAMGAVASSSQFASPLAMLLSAVPGLTFVAVGFFGLVFVQTSRAAVDSAEYGQQALKVSRDQLEVSKQLLKLTQAAKAPTYQPADEALKPINFDTDAPTANMDISTTTTTASAQLKTHKYSGHQIEQTPEGYRLDHDLFATLEAAKKAIDEPKARAYLALNQAEA